MVVPQGQDFKGVDSNYWSRHWGLRRDRSSMNIEKSGSSTTTKVINGTSSSPSVTTVRSSYTPYGSWKRTIDQNNSVWLKGKPIRNTNHSDLGGPFKSTSVVVSPPKLVRAEWASRTGEYRQSVNAYLHASTDGAGWTNSLSQGTISFNTPTLFDAELIREGATGIARTTPTKPEMSLSTAIGELKDGLPSLIGRQFLRDKSLSSIGSEYLNYQFGILPTIRDASDVVKLTRRYEKIVEQFKRDQGRVIRRRTTLVNTKEESTTRVGYMNAYSGYSGNLQTVLISENAETHRLTSKKIWFSGAYSVAYPRSADGLLQDIREFNRVYGVIPNAELAWNLLPWSWLVDWFSNLGDIMSNVSYLTSPSTKMDYGYVMGQTSYRITQRGNFGPDYIHLRSQVGTPVRLSTSVTYTEKRRLKASPFGFGVSFGSLSGKQKSILTALGLSRLRL